MPQPIRPVAGRCDRTVAQLVRPSASMKEMLENLSGSSFQMAWRVPAAGFEARRPPPRSALVRRMRLSGSGCLPLDKSLNLRKRSNDLQVGLELNERKAHAV